MSVTFGFGHIFDRNIIKPHLWVFSRTPNRRSRTCESGFLILSTPPHLTRLWLYLHFLLSPFICFFLSSFSSVEGLLLLLWLVAPSIFLSLLFYCYNRCGSLVTFFFSHHWQCQNARRKVSFVCVCVCLVCPFLVLIPFFFFFLFFPLHSHVCELTIPLYSLWDTCDGSACPRVHFHWAGRDSVATGTCGREKELSTTTATHTHTIYIYIYKIYTSIQYIQYIYIYSIWPPHLAGIRTRS